MEYYKFTRKRKKSDIQTHLHRNQAQIPVETGVTALSIAFGRFLGKEIGSRSRGVSAPPVKAKELFSSPPTVQYIGTLTFIEKYV